ncbi:MAG: manganese efflux pump MntP family protein [Eubacteriales bacterium]|nr:manganese efflux pump MntP family protein [Eubacteriales bacterium]
MDWGILFFVNSILFGIGLAMDAFSVSMANGLNEPEMDRRKELLIAGAFGVFQTLMPLIGWVLVHTAMNIFQQFQKFIPWIALILLCWIGGKMIAEGVQNRKEAQAEGAGPDGTPGGNTAEAKDADCPAAEAKGLDAPAAEAVKPAAKLGLWALFVQAVATSIDALSVGFTIAEYDFSHALVETVIIGVVTFIISYAGIRIGKKFGTRLSGKASILGGVILILIGVEIFVTHL